MLELEQAKLNATVSDLYALAYGDEAAAGLSRDAVVDDPDDVAIILARPDIFLKNYALIDELGKSRFNTNGDMWTQRRQITHNSYTTAARNPFHAAIPQIYADAFDGLENPSLADLTNTIANASMRVFLRALNCQSDPAPFVGFVDRLRGLLIELQHASWLPPDGATLSRLLERTRLAVAGYVELLEADEESAALLTRFAQLMNSTRSQAAEEVLMNMFAGVETTTAVLGWMLNRLGVNAQSQQRLFKEATGEQGDTTYQECFINETMRYFPPIPFVTRTLASDFDLNGRVLQAGRQIMVSIVGLHHNPRAWEDPSVFHSGRPEFINDTYDRQCFMPFIQGARTCGGMRLARLELSAGLNAILKRFEIHNPDASIAFDYALAMRPRPTGALTIVSRRPR